MMDGSMMGWFWIWPVLVLIGLILLGYLAYRLTQNRRPGTDTAPAAGPSSARQILDRVNEISFNSSLMREMRAIKFVSDLIDQGKLSEEDYVKLHVHMIASDALTDFGASSKLNAELDFLLTLKDLGRQTADAWLRQHWDQVNAESTCDLQVFL